MEEFEDDRDIIQNWIVESIEDEYSNSKMKEMILPVFANPKGKKLRPLISLNVFRAIQGEEINNTLEHKIKHVCAAIEISHNASLMIDDVFDKDLKRRGDEAFHVKFGTFAALSAGYNLSAFVFDLATRTDNHKVVRSIGHVGTALSSALFMSQDLVSKKRIKRDFFMDLLYRKTSALFVTAAKCGALVATEDQETINIASKFGEYYGNAYQLRDDVLGIVGNKMDLGKPPLSDITNRFQSLITIEAFEMADREDKQILREFYLKNKEYETEKIQDILIQSGATEKVAKITYEYRRKARELLYSLPPSKSRHKLETLLDKISLDKYEDMLSSN